MCIRQQDWTKWVERRELHESTRSGVTQTSIPVHRRRRARPLPPAVASEAACEARIEPAYGCTGTEAGQEWWAAPYLEQVGIPGDSSGVVYLNRCATARAEEAAPPGALPEWHLASTAPVPPESQGGLGVAPIRTTKSPHSVLTPMRRH
eukprot:scaffold1172_cov409-Prasinococcus_capsulatus_cf.AAC.12